MSGTADSTLAMLALAFLVMTVPSANLRAADPNQFNRLLTPPSERNPTPSEDGIHDPANPSVGLLQSPRTSFESLPAGQSGNYVDWVGALREKRISPRYDHLDPDADMLVLDLNIVREVKGSMPDVVYPHAQHTEWLDCSNCHPAIFVPQKGSNQMSMAGILLGEGCGVCHGKVAFPVSDCRRCHSQAKTMPVSGTEEAAGATPAAGAPLEDTPAGEERQ